MRARGRIFCRLPAVHRARHGAQSHDLEIMTRAKIKSPMLNPLSHIGTQDFPCSWWHGQLWGVLLRNYVRCPHWDLSDCVCVCVCVCVYVWLDWDYGLWRIYLRSTVPFASHHIKSHNCQGDLSLLTLTFFTWPRQYLSHFSAIQLLSSCPFHAVPSGRRLLCAAHTTGVENDVLTPCRHSIYINH